ncbi:MAG: hypothetical protein HY740_09685 [Chloroflexi bacterium]|nr:hypothetical protein [Chloroflexota bacterium]
MFFRYFNLRALGVLAIVLVLATAAYGFAAANIVDESGAGDGANAISGYTISDITYTPNAVDPSMLDKVEFSVTPTAGAAAPTTVRAKLGQSSTIWYNCTNIMTTNTWECLTSGATVADSDELRVVATQ